MTLLLTEVLFCFVLFCFVSPRFSSQDEVTLCGSVVTDPQSEKRYHLLHAKSNKGSIWEQAWEIRLGIQVIKGCFTWGPKPNSRRSQHFNRVDFGL